MSTERRVRAWTVDTTWPAPFRVRAYGAPTSRDDGAWCSFYGPSQDDVPFVDENQRLRPEHVPEARFARVDFDRGTSE